MIKKTLYFTVVFLIVSLSLIGQKATIEQLVNSVLRLKEFSKMQDRHLAITDSFGNVKGVNVHFYYLDSLISKCRQSGDRGLEGVGWMSKGNFYLGVGNNSNSIESFIKSIELFEKEGDNSGLCNASTNIGNTYFYMGFYEKALSYYKKAIVYCKKVEKSRADNNNRLANLYNNLGSVYCSLKDMVYGKAYFSMALSIWTKNNDSLSLAYVFNNFGQIFMETKQYDSAEVYYQRALTIKLRKGDLIDKADGYKSLSALALSKKDTKSALHYVKKSLSYLDTNSFSRQLLDCYSLLTLIYKEQKDAKNELKYYKLFDASNDSVNSREKVSNITKMEMQFEFSKIHLADSIRSVEEIKLRDLKISEKKQQSYFLIFIIILTVVALNMIYSRFKLTKKQKLLIEEKNKEITDSINYAKKIQQSSLPSEKYIGKEIKRLKEESRA